MIENDINNDSNEKKLSENKKLNSKLKVILIMVIIVAILWIMVINPYLTFKKNERDFTTAAEKYFDMYTQELPTGERIGEVTLQTLYNKGYVEKDFYVPYNLINKTTCSVTDSFVKVKKVEGEYKYYTYLQCGALRSKVDHKGPKITLNGNENITISVGEEFSDPGIKSIVDDTDGNIDITKATIKSDKIDTNSVGEYKISYIAFDSLKNKSTITRKITVVQKLNSKVKKETDNLGYYIGQTPNNYITFSGMLYRIVDIDNNNVRIIADKDVANVNYDSISKWLDYYYTHINEESKKIIVKNKYCKMTLQESDTNTTECSSYTDKLNVYIPSIADVNKTVTNDGSFLKLQTMTWMADTKDKNSSYLTRDKFYNEYEDREFIALENKYNFGVRPILTIKGDSLIKAGDGTFENPYDLGDFKVAKADDKVNTRQSGEYLSISGKLWRIQDTLEDGTTKVIYDTTLSEGYNYLLINYDDSVKKQIYKSTEKGNIGYKINNQSSEYIDTKYFVSHEIEVPIYKNDAKYGEEIKTEKSKAKISAPNMYEMFSASSLNNNIRSFWYINSSQNENLKYGAMDVGIVNYGEVSPYVSYGVRPVGYLHKNTFIVSGSGTYLDPYVIDK